MLRWQSLTVDTEATWLAKPKIFTMQPLYKKFTDS